MFLILILIALGITLALFVGARTGYTPSVIRLAWRLRRVNCPCCAYGRRGPLQLLKRARAA